MTEEPEVPQVEGEITPQAAVIQPTEIPAEIVPVEDEAPSDA